ncbi:protein BRI1-5 ENHANCED 1-like isoform X2 [Vicia villosa]|uniref:protein BRI1-5 ENHANCED 1-like isoform X2 n=1 Tax=Vicia villosa TaxID=3911 RepID=UPI00273BC4E9|nr:protein BRI1-5 ENHANCED 1-like isoform X2 [Vicia villosa]
MNVKHTHRKKNHNIERRKENKMGDDDKGTVCVTGATGYIASWLIMKLLQHGYNVHATVRSHHFKENTNLEYLTSLPEATMKLKIFHANLDDSTSFQKAIQGCIGVFHLAHPMDVQNQESEEIVTKRALEGTKGILKACLESKTVKKVIYTSSATTVLFNEKSILEFGRVNGLEVVTLILPLVIGPFICPTIPSSVYIALAMIFGDHNRYEYLTISYMVHIDDAIRALIFLFESENANGRYICSSDQISFHQMYEFLHQKYPEYHITIPISMETKNDEKFSVLSSKKLLDTGFKFKYNVADIYDGAIKCCKEKGIL